MKLKISKFVHLIVSLWSVITDYLVKLFLKLTFNSVTIEFPILSIFSSYFLFETVIFFEVFIE